MPNNLWLVWPLLLAVEFVLVSPTGDGDGEVAAGVGDVSALLVWARCWPAIMLAAKGVDMGVGLGLSDGIVFSLSGEVCSLPPAASAPSSRPVPPRPPSMAKVLKST